MATLTMSFREPTPRSGTPRPTSRIVTKMISIPNLRSPIRSPGSMDSPVTWDNFNLISPSTASHDSPFFPSGEFQSASRGPPLVTSGLLSARSRASSASEFDLISPSAPVQQPGDELLYDIATEARPDERFFDPKFQSALNTTKQEMKDISLAIWGCSAAHQVGSDLHALREWAQNLSEFEPSRTRTVGLVGDSGVGKSSVINSLLDQPDLACSRSDSRSSTSVVTEYRFRPAHHNEPFGMEVDYMTAEEIQELIEELLRTFRLYYLSSFQEIISASEKKTIRMRSEKAWNTLHSMFRNQPLFTKSFLLDYPAEGDASLLNILQLSAASFLAGRPGGCESRMWSAAAFNVDECTDKMDAFLRDPLDANTPALWPFIRVVRIYLRSPVLQSGLVLVDCPSLRDLNYARLRAVERYVRNCHEIFAVTTMDRALEDQGVVDIIKRNGRHRPLRIICTNSENINAKNVERNSPEISVQVRNWRQQIEDLAKQVKRCEARRRHGVPGAMLKETQSRDALQEVEFGLKKFLIERRNYRVATQLIDKYTDDVQLGDLKIFCVSNKEYFEHRHDEQSWAEPRLELSGIVNLRRYCHSIPAEAQFAAASAFIENDAPAFIGSLRQWALGGSDEMSKEKAEELKHIINEIEGDAIRKLVLPTAQIQITRQDLNREFTSNIIVPIREHRTEWRNEAIEASKEWAKYTDTDFLTFCLHHGNHSTPTTGPQSWNTTLLTPMRHHLQPNWTFFLELVSETRKELITSINTAFASINTQLQTHQSTAPNAIANLLATIPPRRNAIIHIISTGIDDFLEGAAQICSDALYGHTTSYISSLMAPAYHACVLESGPAAPNRRKQILTTHVLTTRVFQKLSTVIERHHRAFVRGCFDGIVGDVTRGVDYLVRDLGVVLGRDARGEGTAGRSAGGLGILSPLKIPHEEDDGDEGLREEELMMRRFEARRFPEFVGRLRERLGVAEGVLEGARGVVGCVRGGGNRVV